MLVCRPFSCIFGYVTLVISVRNAVVSVRFNISKHTKTYVISVRIAVDKRVGMLSHEDSWGNLAYCFLPLVSIRSTLWGNSWRDLAHHLFATNDVYALAGHHYAAA